MTNTQITNRAVQREVLRSEVATISDHLEGVWRLDNSEHYADSYGVFLDGPGGQRLFFQTVLHTGRIAISGVYPDHYNITRSDRFEITATRSRGGLAIAREIHRRLQPGYKVELARVNLAIAEHALDKTRRAEAVARLAKLAPGGSVHERTPDEVRWRLLETAGGAYGEVGVNYHAKTVNFKASSLPIELAEEILKVLAKGAGT